MHRVTLCSALLCLLLNACFVSPPEPDSALFACETDSDCASDWACENGFCAKKGGGPTDCSLTGCPDQRVCARHRDGSSTCEEPCDGGHCLDRTLACVRVPGFPDPGQPESEVRACKPCPTGCDPTTMECWPENRNSPIDETPVSCLPGTRCFDESDCDAGMHCLHDPTVPYAGICLPDCAACSDPRSLVCTPLPSFTGQPSDHLTCLGCAPTCADGERCTGMVDNQGAHVPIAQCTCDPTLCEALGPAFRCDGDICTDQCDATSTPCPGSALCDAQAGRCRLDCLAGLGCSPPSTCGWTEQPNGDPAYLCVADACALACGAGDDTCALAPFDVGTECTPPGCAHDLDCGSDRCVFDNQSGGTCHQACTPGGSACPSGGRCVARLNRDGSIFINVCVPAPVCSSPGCTAPDICVYTDRTYTQTACAMNGCTTDSDCLPSGTTTCVFSPRTAPIAWDQPFGVCRQLFSAGCTGGATPVTWPHFPDAGNRQICTNEPAIGDPCGDPPACSAMDRCVRTPADGERCRPTCEMGSSFCLPGESCVSAFTRGPSLPYGTVADVCVPGRDHYAAEALSTNSTWLDSHVGTVAVRTPWTPGTTLIPNGPTFRADDPMGGSMVLVNQLSPAPLSTVLTSGSIPNCVGLPSTGQLGLGELGDTGRYARVVLSCAINNQTGLCAGNPARARVVSVRVRGVTNDCSEGRLEIAETNKDIIHGAIGDGLIAVVRVHAPESNPRFGIRIGKLVASESNPNSVSVVWAPHELFINANWRVNELRVTRDLVAWRMSTSTPDRVQIAAAPVWQFFADQPPMVGHTQDYLVANNEELAGLTADDHWVAWTMRKTDTGSQRLEWVAIDLNNPAAGVLNPEYITARRTFVSDDPYTWVRANIDGNFMVYNDKPDVTPGFELWVRNLTRSAETRTVEFRAAPSIGLPMIKTTGTAGLGLWVYGIEDPTGTVRQVVPIEVPKLP